MKKVNIYTDGACSGNPGPGGYGAILRYGSVEKELSRGFRLTTNNRMEIMGVIAALEALKAPCEATIVSDSQYVINSITKGWVHKWQANNWRKGDKKRAENVDLWEQLIPLLKKHRCFFRWIRGHDGHAENERCDELAVAASKSRDLEVDSGFEESRKDE